MLHDDKVLEPVSGLAFSHWMSPEFGLRGTDSSVSQQVPAEDFEFERRRVGASDLQEELFREILESARWRRFVENFTVRKRDERANPRGTDCAVLNCIFFTSSSLALGFHILKEHVFLELPTSDCSTLNEASRNQHASFCSSSDRENHGYRKPLLLVTHVAWTWASAKPPAPQPPLRIVGDSEGGAS